MLQPKGIDKVPDPIYSFPQLYQAVSIREHHFTFITPSPCHPTHLSLCSISLCCAMESPVLGAHACFSPICFAWCSLSQGIQAPKNSCSCSICLQLPLRSRATCQPCSLPGLIFFLIYPWKSCWTVPTVGTISAAPCLSLMLLLRDLLYSGSSWVTHSRL